jgi:hypothetical protein
MATELGLQFYECSAMDGSNVEEIFEKVTLSLASKNETESALSLTPQPLGLSKAKDMIMNVV